MDLFIRDDRCPSGSFRSDGACYSIWRTVVRWVIISVCLLLAIGAISLFVLRRRRLRNRQPAYAAGWAAPQQSMPMGAYPPGPYAPPPPPGGPPGATQQDFYAAEQQNKPPQYTPPPYSQQQPSYGAPQYEAPQYEAPQYGAPQYGVQQPQSTYQPPEGPPPAK